MASVETCDALAAHPEWIAPRSDVRVFLGEPGAPEASKTTVEPGNTFSPGMLTFGVTWWLRFPNDGFFAPETAPLEALRWQYEEGYLPLVQCDVDTNGLDVRHRLFQAGTAAERSEVVCARLCVSNRRSAGQDVQVFVALRALGPAGGPVFDLAVDAVGRGFRLAQRNLPVLSVDRAPDAIGCGVGDPSPSARAGLVPTNQAVEDPAGWCYGLMRFDLALEYGDTWRVDMDCPQQTYGALHDELPAMASPAPSAFEPRLAQTLGRWRTLLGHVDLSVPDDAFRHAFLAGLGHMLTAVVGDQARIAPLSYPLPWLRDGVFIIRCFDLAGLHELARAATEYCARNDFFGGFGAEGDAPGQGIWALVEHYRTVRDPAWLETVYPAIRRKCDYLMRMRRATAPIRVVVDTPVLAFTHAERATGVICLASADGLIQGVMDQGVAHAVGWVNHWALRGLEDAAFAARELDHEDDAVLYSVEAEDLREALRRYARTTPSFFDQERTVNSLLWPTRAWSDDLQAAREGFDRWWQQHRSPDEAYVPEPYWLYFELAQAHNALLLGRRERAWQVIEYRLRHQDLPGLFGWREGRDGVGTENAVRGVTLVPHIRGCQRFESITPHGWSQAEMWLLQRAVLIEEWGGGLLLFAGVPAHWLASGATVSFRDFPTHFGAVSAELSVDEDGRTVAIAISGVAATVPVAVRLPGGTASAFGSGRMTIRLE